MYAKIFTQIYDSSIADDVAVRHFFMDMLLLCDAEGVVDMIPSSISARTRIPLAEVNRLLGLLQEPDLQSRSPENEGRRIILLPGRTWGWKITNYKKYRDVKSQLDRSRISNSSHYGGYVYFLSTDETAGDIKIGFSVNPWARASEVSTSCPDGCVILGQIKGGKDTEAEWHERFKEYRKNGEWFKRTPEMIDAIKTACGGVGTTVVTKKHRSTTPAMQKQRQKQIQKKKDMSGVLKDLPVHLNTARMVNKWQVWMTHRRAYKKPSSWLTLFNEQIEWLAKFEEPEAFEILSSSIRNGYQGLFPPKQGKETHHGNPEMTQAERDRQTVLDAQ